MKRILIIEDDLGIAELERDYLEANGFAVAIETAGTDDPPNPSDSNT